MESNESAYYFCGVSSTQKQNKIIQIGFKNTFESSFYKLKFLLF